ncbi:MAG: protein kinase [Myxococcales bacterium]|nr:protein kinase [Myxococcales bacterium]
MPGAWNGQTELVPGLLVADRYRLDRRIGQGGMGSVWAASHMVTRRAVALKFLRRSEESEESRRRFLREARAASAVSHPNVVEVLDFLEVSEGSPILVLELLQGECLSSLLARVGKLSVAQTSEIMSAVVSAVGAAHAEGIIHRDLKPDNIFLQRERDGSTLVKVLDFGIAKVTLLDDDTRKDAGLTHTGAILGTPLYMSPEQVFAEADLDHRADIWALGIILYRCLSGIVPTEAPSVGQVYKIIVAGSIAPLREVAPHVPPELASLIDGMLSRDRSARPSDLRPVLQVLQRFAEREAPSFGPPRAASRPGAAIPAAAGDEESTETLALTGDTRGSAVPSEAPARRRWLVPAGVGVALVIGAALAVSRSSPPEPLGAAAVSEPERAAPAAPVAATGSSSSPIAPLPSAQPDPPVESAAARAPVEAKRPRATLNRPSPSAAPKSLPHPEDPYGF